MNSMLSTVVCVFLIEQRTGYLPVTEINDIRVCMKQCSLYWILLTLMRFFLLTDDWTV